MKSVEKLAYCGCGVLALLALYLGFHPEVFDRQFRSGVTVINANTLVENGTTYIPTFDERTKKLLDEMTNRPPMVVCGEWNSTVRNSSGTYSLFHLDACRDLLSEPENNNRVATGIFGVSLALFLGVATVKIREELRERLIH